MLIGRNQNNLKTSIDERLKGMHAAGMSQAKAVLLDEALKGWCTLSRHYQCVHRRVFYLQTVSGMMIGTRGCGYSH